MRAPLDYLRLIAEAHTDDGDTDARAARPQHPGGRRRRFRLPSWLTEVRGPSGDGLSMPALRDYPWRSTDGA